MKLYANGCSFTYGHWLQDEEPHPVQESWPTHLENHFDEVVNEAWQGGSSHRAIRRTINHMLNNDKPDDWIYVVQLTGIARTEFYDPEFDSWFGVHPTHPNARVADDLANNLGEPGTVIGKERILLLRKHRDRANLTQLTDNNDHTLWRTIIEQLIVLDAVAREKNTTVLVTSMNTGCDPTHYLTTKPPTEASKLNCVLFNMIKDLHFIDSIGEVIGSNEAGLRDECGHPNKNGHAEIARYIHSQLITKDLI
jgi:hypothetical protein